MSMPLMQGCAPVAIVEFGVLNFGNFRSLPDTRSISSWKNISLPNVWSTSNSASARTSLCRLLPRLVQPCISHRFQSDQWVEPARGDCPFLQSHSLGRSSTAFWNESYAKDLYSHATLGEAHQSVGNGPFQDMAFSTASL